MLVAVMLRGPLVENGEWSGYVPPPDTVCRYADAVCGTVNQSIGLGLQKGRRTSLRAMKADCGIESQ